MQQQRCRILLGKPDDPPPARERVVDEPVGHPADLAEDEDVLVDRRGAVSTA